MKIERKVLSGIMNMDDPNDAMPGMHHKDAQNITFKGNTGQLRAEGVPGNQLVTNSNLQSGTNTCIGAYYDELKQRVFYFIANSNGYDGIYIYSTISKAITPLLISKINSQSTEAIFSFNVNNPIASVNILYRTEADGDILHWTDRNERPMKLNIKDTPAPNGLNIYGNYWKKEYLTVARKTPLIAPICKYFNDSTISVNNLKNKVYQFRYRWVYKDFTKSTWSPYSRLFAPDNVDLLANNKDQTKNNAINIKINSGSIEVVKIEICARHSIESTFTDCFLVETLDKSTSSIPNDSVYEYSFYNTEAYPYLDVTETNILFDYVPLKANTQELLNGNVIIYGGITEGRTPGVSLNVSKNVTSVVNSNTSTLFTSTAYNQYYVVSGPIPDVSGYMYITFNGVPQVGDQYVFNIILTKTIENGTGGYITTYVTVTQTIPITLSNNTLPTLQTDLYNRLIADSNFSAYDLTGAVTTLNNVDPIFPGKYGIRIGFYKSSVTPGGPGPSYYYITYCLLASFAYTYVGGGLPVDPTGINNACYKHQSRYTFGICYFDEYGVTNGVMTTPSMKVITPEVTLSTGVISGNQFKIPSIEFSISNQAPLWAKYFSFVKTKNLTVGEFKTMLAERTFKDASNTYGYLDISKYQANLNGYPAYSFADGDRVRVIGTLGTSTIIATDYAILDLVTSAEYNAANPTATIPNDGIWLKLNYDVDTMSAYGTSFILYIEVYTPSLNTSTENQLFYEFGETYPVIVSGSNYYHTGMTQNQTSSLPAKFTFVRGDIYSRQRDGNGIWVLDMSMSDRFKSKIDGLGRPFIQDPYASQTYYPTLVRYSLEYQAGTNINNTNRFYAANFDEYDREKGDIQRLKTRGRQMRVFQNRACGVVPILQSLVQTADGSGVLSQSSEIINKIQYYLGEYGVGNQFCCIASSAQSDYFTDPVRGCQVRLSGDGITPISELYKAHYTLTPLINKYNNVNRVNITGYGYAKILSIYDQFNEECITYMQESTGSLPTKSEPKTFGFNEMKNSYSSFYEYYPEWAINAENVVITWKSGQLWTHDNTTNYANFYGVQKKPSITLVFNQYETIKKRYNTITMLCNKAWIPNTNGDITTNLGQTSSLQLTDFIFRDDKFHASFKRDSLSTGGLYNGNVLKGNWAQIKLQPVNGNEFVNLYYIELSILEPFYNR